MYTVKEVSEIFNISVHTIRYYDKEHLFPYVTRGKHGERLFSDEDLQWVQLVKCMRQADMPLSEIRRYSDLCKLGDSTIPERYEMMLEQKTKIEANLEDMKKRLDYVEYKVKFYKDLMAGKKPDTSCNPMNVVPEKKRKQAEE